MVDLCSCLGSVEPARGTPLRCGTIVASADAPSLSIDPRLAGFRAELRELGVFFLCRGRGRAVGRRRVRFWLEVFDCLYFLYYGKREWYGLGIVALWWRRSIFSAGRSLFVDSDGLEMESEGERR